MPYKGKMLTNSQDLIILTSPPASGKTYWIAKLKESKKSDKILVISPLRALADECKQMWGTEILVMTPEEWLGKKTFCDVVIFDEFHLFFYWGDSFRPSMWEVFFELSLFSSETYLLTATLSEKMRMEISLFSSQYDSIFWHDHGNQQLKFKPFSYIKAPDKKWIQKQIENESKQKDVKLIFCQYRDEVMDLETKLSKLGFACLSCIGGESKLMAGKLKSNPHPDFIIATTVLSHGVNLPEIRKIYFLYKVENLDFWIQMVARGGRNGQKYEVIALERPHQLPWNSLHNFFKLCWTSLRAKMSPSQLFLN